MNHMSWMSYIQYTPIQVTKFFDDPDNKLWERVINSNAPWLKCVMKAKQFPL